MHEQLPDARPAPAELDTPALATFRTAVSALAVRPADAGLLRAAVCALAREARARGVAPERLIIHVKALWAEETAAHPSDDRRSQGELFDQMITLCIREYFAA